MIRDFTQAKKEELYSALDRIDGREWRSFMTWCGGRAAGFGEWADRLGISSYTRRIDNYQNRILEINEDARNQVNVAFESVAEADRGYADIFRRHAETVREQIRRAQAMLQVMQSVNRAGSDMRTLVYGMRIHPEIPYAERLENGKRVLQSYLKVRGIADAEKQREICELIMEKRAYMLEDLYMADLCGSVDAGAIYDLIMDYCNEYMREKELACAEEKMNIFLISIGYTNSIERGFIIAAIQKMQPQLLMDWYHADIYSAPNCEEVTKSIEKYYVENKENIGLDVIEERFRNDENANHYSVVCGYLEYLVDLQYICQAEYDQYVSGMEEGDDIGKDKKEEICEFMVERMEFIKSFEYSKEMLEGVTDGKWTREQIMCALQIETKLLDAGLDKVFIAGLIGNVKSEGGFGIFEGVNRDGKLKGKDKDYWIHMIECVDYFHIYNKKNLTDINLLNLYVDLISKKESGKCINPENHKIGIGSVQWTQPDRSKKLMEFYLEQAGYDMNSVEFSVFIQEWENKEEKDKVFLSKEQIRDAEIKMIVYEMTSEDVENTCRNFYKNYWIDRNTDNQDPLYEATRIIMEKYERPSIGSLDKRLAAAKRWYEYSSKP